MYSTTLHRLAVNTYQFTTQAEERGLRSLARFCQFSCLREALIAADSAQTGLAFCHSPNLPVLLRIPRAANVDLPSLEML